MIKGIDFKTYVSLYADEEIKNAEKLFNFNYEELQAYKDLLEKFETINSSSYSQKEKGKALEEIVSFILNKSIIFEVYRNVSTSSNEIDLLVRLNKKGIYFITQGLLSFEQKFLCECKNYNSKISATWVGKFYSLLRVTSNKLGIIFSYHGLTGKNWDDAIGLTKKFYLKSCEKIIDFNISDFKKLAEGESFIDLINNKIFALQNDTNINKFIKEHPNSILLNYKT
jgi:hypothetical protein